MPTNNSFINWLPFVQISLSNEDLEISREQGREINKKNNNFKEEKEFSGLNKTSKNKIWRNVQAFGKRW